MTDRPDTNQDLQMTLAQIEETLAHAANPAALVDGVSAQLGTLYTSAEASGDNNAMVAIEQTWNNVQMLAKSVAANREAYLTAKDIAETLRNQRDNIAREHGELIDDLENVNLNNPRVRHIHNEGLDSAFDEYEGFHCDCPGCACYETGHLPDISHDGINMLIHALMGSYGELTEKQTRQLTSFVNLFETSLEKSFARNWEIAEDGDDDDE